MYENINNFAQKRVEVDYRQIIEADRDETPPQGERMHAHPARFMGHAQRQPSSLYKQKCSRPCRLRQAKFCHAMLLSLSPIC